MPVVITNKQRTVGTHRQCTGLAASMIRGCTMHWPLLFKDTFWHNGFSAWLRLELDAETGLELGWPFASDIDGYNPGHQPSTHVLATTTTTAVVTAAVYKFVSNGASAGDGLP